MSTQSNPRGIFSFALITAMALGLLGYCTPAPAADDDFWPTQERAAQQFDRYQRDINDYIERTDAAQRQQERDTTNALLCGRSSTSTLCRAYGDPQLAPRLNKRGY
jgi:hypothetical protein